VGRGEAVEIHGPADGGIRDVVGAGYVCGGRRGEAGGAPAGDRRAGGEVVTGRDVERRAGRDRERAGIDPAAVQLKRAGVDVDVPAAVERSQHSQRCGAALDESAGVVEMARAAARTDKGAALGVEGGAGEV